MRTIVTVFHLLPVLLPFLLFAMFRWFKRSLKWVDDVLEWILLVVGIKAFWPAKKRKVSEARGPLGDAAALVGLLVAVVVFWFGGLFPWKVLAAVYAWWWFTRSQRRRVERLAGEADTEAGHRRAAERAAVSKAITAALQQLFSSTSAAGVGMVRVPSAPLLTVIASGRVSVNQGGRVVEVGWWVDVKTSGRVTVDSLRARSGQVFARGADAICATVNEILPSVWPKKYGRAPQFIASNVTMAARRDGQEIPGRARVSVLLEDPFAVPHPVPYTVGQRYVRDITKGVPVGVRGGGSEVLLELWHRHTLVSGQSRWGKSALCHSILYALSPQPHVAFVLLDLKGTELGNWSDRASFFAHGPQESAQALRAVIAEMGRRTVALRAKGQQKVVRPSAEFPLLLVLIDEAQDMVEGSRVTAEEAAENEAMFKEIAKKGAALGITLVIASQMVKAKLLDTDVTSQMNQLSAKQVTLSAAGVAIGMQRATKNFGPHLIPDNRQRYAGVIAGSFADSTSDEYARIFYIHGNGKLARARAKRCASRRVDLPWLDPEPVPAELEPAMATGVAWHGFRRRLIVVADLPDTVVERLEVLADILDADLPAEGLSKRDLWSRLVTPAVTKANNDQVFAGRRAEALACRDEVDGFISDGVVPGPLNRGDGYGVES